MTTSSASSRRVQLAARLALLASLSFQYTSAPSPAFAQGTRSKELIAMCLAAGDRLAVADQCAPVWADSLRSTDKWRSFEARGALEEIGGRAAVDALLADYRRSLNVASRLAAINTMTTTGSVDDIAFLIRHLRGPVATRDDSVAIWSSAKTLGVLQAAAARDSLRAALKRFGQGNPINYEITTAIARIDRPPCFGTIVGDTVPGLVGIAIQCAAPNMNTRLRYPDKTNGGTWQHVLGSWRLTAATPAEKAEAHQLRPPSGSPYVRNGGRIRSDGRHATVWVQSWCGGRCGQSWSYDLYFNGLVWRVLSSRMVAIS